MKRIQLLLLTVICATTMYAQLSGDGYYRVQNEKTERYIAIRDNRGSVNMSTTDADFGALQTVLGFERVVSDPASVIYFKKMTSGYDIQSQGASSYEMIEYELRLLTLKNDRYAAYATAHGMTKYLCDNIPNWMMRRKSMAQLSLIRKNRAIGLSSLSRMLKVSISASRPTSLLLMVIISPSMLPSPSPSLLRA